MGKQFISILIAVMIALLAYLLPAQYIQGTARAARFSISRPIYARAAASGVSREARRLKPDPNPQRDSRYPADHRMDRNTGSGRSMPEQMLSPPFSFDGISNYDNMAAFGVFFLPPDPSGDIGPEYYVQAVNSLVRVYDKAGDPVTQPFRLSQIFAPLGTACAARDDGQPTVLYDPMADRWFLSEYCTNFPPFRQMIAVSRTGDPAGEYYIYEFVMPSLRLNDVARFGVWADGYYMSTEEYLGSDFSGSGIFAFDRGRMLVGDPSAGFIYFSVSAPAPEHRRNFLPSDIDGLTPPPAGAPNTIATYTADEYGDEPDALRLFDLHANFERPELSTFSERPESPISVAAFDPTSPSGRADIMPPSPGTALDSNSDRLMSRLAYRNFGTFEALVLNQTVRASAVNSPYRPGVRVYSLRRTGAAYAIDRQSTIADDPSSRWIASVAQDGQGNLAAAYNRTSDIEMPSLVYAEIAADGAIKPENVLIAGTGVQTAFGFRWGDWSSLSVDPVDDCTFWMTGEYYTAESQAFSPFTWLTRIGGFRFDECIPATRGSLIISVTGSDGGPLPDAKVNLRSIDLPALAPYFRQTRADGQTSTILLSPGGYVIEVSASGYRTALIQTFVSGGGPTNLTVHLQADPLIENASHSFAAESCSIDHAAEPGETVTLDASFRNVGHTITRRLQIALTNSDQIITTEPPKNFGILLPNGSLVTRSFTFTVSPDVRCGDPVSLNFRVMEGLRAIGNISLQLPTGVPKTALNENFDAVAAPGLPDGWTTSATGGQLLWATSAARSQSPPNAVFSPDPIQPGVNELISPTFSITSEYAVLSFTNWYDLEATYLRNKLFDGAVLEIKIGTADWQDIISAGGEFETGGYDGTIDSCCQNPLAGRAAWSGTSGIDRPANFVPTRVRLPSSAAGETVQLRWLVATDNGTFREGQYIDNVDVTDGYSCGCAGPGKQPDDQ